MPVAVMSGRGDRGDPSPVAHTLPSSKAYTQVIALLDQAQSHPPGGCRCAGAPVGPVILCLPYLFFDRLLSVAAGRVVRVGLRSCGRYCADRTRPETRRCLVGTTS
jgi:hypothetical protein